jgi:hypothetical protein
LEKIFNNFFGVVVVGGGRPQWEIAFYLFWTLLGITGEW